MACPTGQCDYSYTCSSCKCKAVYDSAAAKENAREGMSLLADCVEMLAKSTGNVLILEKLERVRACVNALEF